MNTSIQPHQSSSAPKRLLGACLSTCRRLLAQTRKIKDAILAEFSPGVGDYQHLLRLALNEAEALARQTSYPHLLFPVLAAEKAESVKSWHDRQEALRQIRHRQSHHSLLSVH